MKTEQVSPKVTQLYNIMEDSFLGDVILGGAMSIMYSGGVTSHRMHPFHGDYTQTTEFTKEQYDELLAQIQSVYTLVEEDADGLILSLDVADCFVIFTRQRDENTFTFCWGTAYNVWEIEDKRYNSPVPEENEKAKDNYFKLRDKKEGY